MISGLHEHQCPKCGKEYVCPQVTHCRKPAHALCWEHISVEAALARIRRGERKYEKDKG